MFELPISWLGLLISAAAGFLSGWFWYHPAVFGTAWAKSLGFNIGDMKCDASLLLKAYINTLITAFFVALFIHWTNSHGLWQGAVVGFWIAVGFYGTSHIAGVLWEKRPMEAFWITTGGSILNLTVIGAVLGLFT